VNFSFGPVFTPPFDRIHDLDASDPDRIALIGKDFA